LVIENRVRGSLCLVRTGSLVEQGPVAQLLEQNLELTRYDLTKDADPFRPEGPSKRLLTSLSLCPRGRRDRVLRRLNLGRDSIPAYGLHVVLLLHSDDYRWFTATGPDLASIVSERIDWPETAAPTAAVLTPMGRAPDAVDLVFDAAFVEEQLARGQRLIALARTRDGDGPGIARRFASEGPVAFTDLSRYDAERVGDWLHELSRCRLVVVSGQAPGTALARWPTKLPVVVVGDALNTAGDEYARRSAAPEPAQRLDAFMAETLARSAEPEVSALPELRARWVEPAVPVRRVVRAPSPPSRAPAVASPRRGVEELVVRRAATPADPERVALIYHSQGKPLRGESSMAPDGELPRHALVERWRGSGRRLVFEERLGDVPWAPAVLEAPETVFARPRRAPSRATPQPPRMLFVVVRNDADDYDVRLELDAALRDLPTDVVVDWCPGRHDALQAALAADCPYTVVHFAAPVSTCGGRPIAVHLEDRELDANAWRAVSGAPGLVLALLAGPEGPPRGGGPLGPIGALDDVTTVACVGGGRAAALGRLYAGLASGASVAEAFARARTSSEDTTLSCFEGSVGPVVHDGAPQAERIVRWIGPRPARVELIGRRRERQALERRLDRHGAVCIAGLAGMGKRTLAADIGEWWLHARRVSTVIMVDGGELPAPESVPEGALVLGIEPSALPETYAAAVAEGRLTVLVTRLGAPVEDWLAVVHLGGLLAEAAEHLRQMSGTKVSIEAAGGHPATLVGGGPTIDEAVAAAVEGVPPEARALAVAMGGVHPSVAAYILDDEAGTATVRAIQSLLDLGLGRLVDGLLYLWSVARNALLENVDSAEREVLEARWVAGSCGLVREINELRHRDEHAGVQLLRQAEQGVLEALELGARTGFEPSLLLAVTIGVAEMGSGWHDQVTLGRLSALRDALGERTEVLVASSAHRHIDDLLRLGHLDEAVAAARDAVAAGGDAEDRALALQDLARAEALSGRGEAALETLEAARESLGDAAPAGRRIAIEIDRAMVLSALGRHVAATKAAGAAADSAKEAGRLRLEATALVHLGTAHLELGHNRRSVDAFARAAESYDALGDRRGRASAKHQLGIALHHAGELDKARASLIQAADAFESLGDASDHAASRGQLAAVEAQRGEVASAIENLRSVADTFASVGHAPHEATARHNTAELLRAEHRYAEATEEARRSIELQARAGAEQAWATWSLLAEIEREAGHSEKSDAARHTARAFYLEWRGSGRQPFGQALVFRTLAEMVTTGDLEPPNFPDERYRRATERAYEGDTTAFRALATELPVDASVEALLWLDALDARRAQVE